MSPLKKGFIPKEVFWLQEVKKFWYFLRKRLYLERNTGLYFLSNPPYHFWLQKANTVFGDK